MGGPSHDLGLATPRRTLNESSGKENVTPCAADVSPSLAKTVRKLVESPASKITFQPPPAFVDAPSFDIDEIMGHKINNGKVVYLVRWLGYGSADDSWEAEPHFLAQAGGRVAIAEYRAKDGMDEQLPPLSKNDAARVARSLHTNNPTPPSASVSKTGVKGSVKDFFPVVLKNSASGEGVLELEKMSSDRALSREERQMLVIMKQFELLEKEPVVPKNSEKKNVPRFYPPAGHQEEDEEDEEEEDGNEEEEEEEEYAPIRHRSKRSRSSCASPSSSFGSVYLH